jgi:PmbA protein
MNQKNKVMMNKSLANQQQLFKQLSEQCLQQLPAYGIDSGEVAIDVVTGLTVTVRNGEVEKLEHQWDKNAELTIFKDGHTATTSTSALTAEAMQTLIEKGRTIMAHTDADPNAGLADPSRLAYDYPDLDLYHDWEITTQQAIDMALDCECKALMDERQNLYSEGVALETQQSYVLYANTHGFIGNFCQTEHALVCSLMAKSGADRQRDSEFTVSRQPTQLATVDHLARSAARKTLSRLGASRLKTQQCPVLFTPDTAQTLISHLINAISGSRLYKRASFLLDQLNEKVFPDDIIIEEKPHMASALGSRPFDSEGVATYDKLIIDQGYLRTYLLGSYPARRLALETTGNAGGISNIIVRATAGNLDALVKQMDRGLMVTELLGQGVNLVTGDYSRGAFGYWVENGRIQYPVHEVTIAGNLAEMFRNIIAIGSDVDRRGSIQSGSILLSNMSIAGE